MTFNREEIGRCGALARSQMPFNALNPIVKFWLHHTSTAHCACVQVLRQKGGTGGGGLGHPQGDMHKVAARL